MESENLKIRPATRADADDLAQLANMAGEGLPEYFWTRSAAEGESPMDVGRSRAAREEGSFSWRNASILETSGKVAACLVGYALPDEPEPIDTATMPAMFVPLQELENLVPGTWYVNVLATYPGLRGRGCGARLLEYAEGLARDRHIGRMSIIVSDGNPGAWRLYERTGYREMARRTMVKDDWVNPGVNWLLLTKDL